MATSRFTQNDDDNYYDGNDYKVDDDSNSKYE